MKKMGAVTTTKTLEKATQMISTVGRQATAEWLMPVAKLKVPVTEEAFNL